MDKESYEKTEVSKIHDCMRRTLLARQHSIHTADITLCVVSTLLYNNVVQLWFVINQLQNVLSTTIIIVFHIRLLYRKILHLTDVHIDLAYMEGAEAACGSKTSKTTKKTYKSIQIVPYIFDLLSPSGDLGIGLV